MFHSWLLPFAPVSFRRTRQARYHVALPSPYRLLRLERLEDRLAPATHIWIGAVDGSWSNNANWADNSSPAGDTSADLVFPSTATTFTTTNDITTPFGVQSI